MKTAKVQLRIPLELHARIVEWASKSHRSMNGQICAVLEEMLQEQTKTATQPELSTGKEA